MGRFAFLRIVIGVVRGENDSKVWNFPALSQLRGTSLMHASLKIVAVDYVDIESG